MLDSKKQRLKDNILARITGNTPKFGFNQLVKLEKTSEHYTVIGITVNANNEWFYNLHGSQNLFWIDEEELIEV